MTNVKTCEVHLTFLGLDTGDFTGICDSLLSLTRKSSETISVEINWSEGKRKNTFKTKFTCNSK